MGVPRFYRVIRGQRGQAAKDKYINYLNGIDIEDNVGGGAAKPPSQSLYVRSFSGGLPNTVWLRVSASTSAWGNFGTVSAIASRTKETVATGNSSVKIRGFKAARVSKTTGIASSGTRKTSTKTGLAYLSYGGDSLSLPFGKSGDSDTYAAAIAEIEPLLKTSSSIRVSFTEELI